MVFNKVLVGVGRAGTDQWPLLQQTFELVKAIGSQLMIFHTVQEKTAAEMEDRIATVAELRSTESVAQRARAVEEELRHIRAWLEELCRSARNEGIENVFSSTDVGIPGPAIVAMAEHWGADLIVLGRRRHGALSELLGRGAGNYVHRHAKCSVLFIYEGKEETD